MAGLFVAAAMDVAAEAEPRTGFFGPRAAPRTPEVMIYFSRPVGAGPGATGMRPMFGLRVQEVRQVGDSSNPAATADPMRRREWLSWQADMRSAFHVSSMRLKLGSRLTYDLTNYRFGSPKDGLGMQVAYPSGSTPPGLILPGRQPTGDNATEIAAAVTAGMPLGRFASAQPQLDLRVGEPAKSGNRAIKTVLSAQPRQPSSCNRCAALPMQSSGPS